MRDLRYKIDETYKHSFKIFLHFNLNSCPDISLKCGGIANMAKLYCIYKKHEANGLAREFFKDDMNIFSNLYGIGLLKFGRHSVLELEYVTYLELKKFVERYELEERLQAELETEPKITTKKVKI